MAGIEVYNKTDTSFSVKLTGLQTSADGVDYMREAWWFAYDINNQTSTDGGTVLIYPDDTEGGYYTFKGMDLGYYQVICEIYRFDTYQLLKELRTSTFSIGIYEDLWQDLALGIRNNIKDKQTYHFKLDAGWVHRMPFTCKYSGTLKVWAVQNEPLDLYLSTSEDFNAFSGQPDPYLVWASDDEDPVGTGQGPSIIYNVKAGTTYYVWVSYGSFYDEGYYTVYIQPPAESETPTIEKWDWSASNGDNTTAASQTISAYNAINGTGTGRSTLNFSHNVWNDMVDKVKDIMDVAVGWWDIDWADYNSTRMTSPNANGEYELTAVMFNSLRNNIEIAGNTDVYIGLGYRTGIGPVSSGDYVYGDYFLTLADYINDCIDNL